MADPFGFIQGQKTNSIGVYNGVQWAPLTPTQFAALVNALIDHGTLLGLTDDDHAQYLLVDGSRALTNAGGSGTFLAITSTAADNQAGIQLNARRSSANKTWSIFARGGLDAPNDRLGFYNSSTLEKLTLSDAGGLSVNAVVDPGAGVINANTGFQISNAAALGNILVGNATNFVAASTAWITVSYTAGDFTADTGTWTVDSGDLIAFSYYLVGKIMHITWVIATSSNSSAAATRLEILIPAGKTANRRVVGHGIISESGTDFNANVQAIPSISGTKILIFKNAAASSTYAANTNTLTVLGSITLETT